MTVPHGVDDRILGGERQTAGLWTHNGKLVVLGGPVVLPTGTVQERVGTYAQLVAYTLPTSNVWTETPVQAMATFEGGLVRIEFNVFLGCPTKGQRIVWGIMLDGANPDQALGALDAPENNFGMMASGTYYVPSTPGSGRIGFGLYGPAGTQIYAALPSTLYLTEQRR